MRRRAAAALVLTLAACNERGESASPKYRPGAVQSPAGRGAGDDQRSRAGDRRGPDSSRYPAAAVSLLSGPHIAYNPPPTLGLWGFGFSGCCSGFGSGLASTYRSGNRRRRRSATNISRRR